MLSDLTSDEVEVVTRGWSPREVGRLMCTCKALAVEAVPRHPAWAVLRAAVREKGWDRACAVAGGHLLALLWARVQGCVFDELTCVAAANGGQLETLRWLRALKPMPCRWDYRTCTAAAVCGFLEVLQWCHAQTPRCPWDEGACAAAAQEGHLEVLQWLRAQRAPWDKDACVQAALGGRLEILQWLRSQTPPCP